MKERLVNPRLCGALAACAIAAGTCESLEAALSPNSGRSIQFAAPQEQVSTNLNNRATKSSSLDNLRSIDQAPGLSFRRPGDGAIAPVPPIFRSPQQSTKMKEMLERRKNWSFMTPDQLLGVPDEQQQLSRTFGEDKDKDKHEELNLTVAERYFLDLQVGENSKDPDRDVKSRRDKKDERDTDKSNLPESLRAQEENLRTLLGDPRGFASDAEAGPGLGLGMGGLDPGSGFAAGFVGLGASSKQDQATDFFGLKQPNTTTNPDLSEKRKAQLQEFHKELGLTTMQSALQELYKPPPAMDPAKATSTPGGGLASTLKTKPVGDLQIGNATGPSLANIPDFGAKGPAGLPNFSPPGITPQLNNPGRLKPVAPTFSAPKRVF